MKEIIVTIDPDGSTTVETKGFAGAECLAATLNLEKALGKKIDDVKTREFHKTTATAATVKAR